MRKKYGYYKHSKFLEFIKTKRFNEASFVKEYNSLLRKRYTNPNETKPFLSYYNLRTLLEGKRKFRIIENAIFCELLEITPEKLHEIFNQ